MKFGIRQCANIVFRAKKPMKLGTAVFRTGQPVLLIDSAQTSSLEQATTSVYAQGGRGNARLIAWEGDKTLTFTVTDALLSQVSLAMLSGAGLIKDATQQVHVHANTATTMTVVGTTGTIDLTDALADFGDLNVISVDAGTDAPIYIMDVEDDGSVNGTIITGTEVTYAFDNSTKKATLTVTNPKLDNGIDPATAIEASVVDVMVDYYVIKSSAKVSEIQFTAEDFAGYYYVEADTLFRNQSDGKDMPANLTFPNVKLQSGFTIAMSGTGDPSTFDFTMDAFPGYTYFDKTKKVLCVIQVVEDRKEEATNPHSVMLVDDNPDQAQGSMDYDSDTGEP